VVSSFFDNMTSATTAIDLRLTRSRRRSALISLLPELLTGSGVIDNGKPISYEEMQELLRKEILALNATFSTDVRSNRVEIQMEGAGNDLPESRRAIEWMRWHSYIRTGARKICPGCAIWSANRSTAFAPPCRVPKEAWL